MEAPQTPAETKTPARLPVPAVARALGASPQTVTRLIQAGQLGGAIDIRTRQKHFYRVSLDGLAAFEKRRAAGNPDQDGQK